MRVLIEDEGGGINVLHNNDIISRENDWRLLEVLAVWKIIFIHSFRYLSFPDPNHNADLLKVTCPSKPTDFIGLISVWLCLGLHQPSSEYYKNGIHPSEFIIYWFGGCLHLKMNQGVLSTSAYRTMNTSYKHSSSLNGHWSLVLKGKFINFCNV